MNKFEIEVVYEVMKVRTPVQILLVLSLASSLLLGQDPIREKEAVEKKAVHSWTFSAVNFSAAEPELSQFWAEASEWLKQHGFEEAEGNNAPASSRRLSKLEKGRGRITIVLEKDGQALLEVRSFEPSPKNANFRADALLQYKPFAIWANSHRANLSRLEEDEAKREAKSLDDRVLAFRKKAKGGIEKEKK